MDQIEFNNDDNKQKDDMKNDTQITENINFITDEININYNNTTDENMSGTILLNELDNETNISNNTQESTLYEINDNISNKIYSDDITSELLSYIIDEEKNNSIINFNDVTYSSIIDYKVKFWIA